MATSKWLAGLSVIVLGAALVTGQQQQSTTQPAQQTQRRASRGRLTQPWTAIKDLSDDVKAKIIAIHRKTLDERAALDARERDDIFALLNDEQKKEVNGYEAQNGRRGAGRRGAATRPAGQ
jgi:hypothetical protein